MRNWLASLVSLVMAVPACVHAFLPPPPHPAFQAHLETDPDRKVYFCYPTTPGWEYQIEEAGDPAGPWQAQPQVIYGGGQMIRAHMYTIPDPAVSDPVPPPVAEERPYYSFLITHFSNHPGCIVNWRQDGVPCRCYLPDVEFNDPSDPVCLDIVCHKTPDEVIFVMGMGIPVWSPENASLPRSALTAAQDTTLSLLLANHSAIQAAFADHQQQRSFTTTQPAAPGPKRFFRVRASTSDFDGDGMANSEEMEIGSDVYNSDTDGDGYTDLEEWQWGTDPVDASSIPPAPPGTPAPRRIWWESRFRGLTWEERASSTNGGTEDRFNGWGYDVRSLPAGRSAALLNSDLESFPWGRWTQMPGYAWPSRAASLHWIGEQPHPAGLVGSTALTQKQYRLRRNWTEQETKAKLFRHRARMTFTDTEVWSGNSVLGFPPQRFTTTEFALEEFTIAGGQTSSVGFISATPLVQSEGWKEEVFPPEEAPSVLAVNSDFDEGRIDSATRFAIPDCDDSGHSLVAEQAHLDGLYPAGAIVTDDMAQTWFGLKPERFSTNFYSDATITINKVASTDPDSGRLESGEVRFYAQSPAIPGGFFDIETENSQGPVDLVTGGVPSRPGNSIYGGLTCLPAGANLLMEGVKPGWITLQWRMQKGGQDLRFQQRFLVATQKSKTEWVKDIRYQVLLQSDGKVDLNHYLPDSGWLPRAAPESAIGSRGFVHHHPRVAAIYNWYGQLYQQYPDKLDWPGAAAMVGGAVFGGLSDFLEPVGPGGFSTEDELQGGQILIFRDLGWQHRAWVASGIWALDWVDKNDPGSINGLAGQNALDLPIWVRIDTAVMNSNWAAIKAACRDLVDREQGKTIVPMWERIEIESSGFLPVVSSQAKHPIDPLCPKFQDVVPWGKIQEYDHRNKFSFGWPGGSIGGGAPTVGPATAAQGIFPVWWGDQPMSSGALNDKAARIALVRTSLRTRALNYAYYGHVP